MSGPSGPDERKPGERAPGAKARLDSLTGLRFVAALVVFGTHLKYGGNPFGAAHRFLAQGATGVSFFFVLSGFVLAWAHRPGDTPRAFYQRRIARIVPNHLVASALAAAVIIANGGGLTPRRTAPSLVLLQSWVPNYHVYFAVNFVAWSLSCEAFFYLAFPVIAPRVLRLGPTARRRLMIGLFAAIGVVALLTHPGLEDSTKFWVVYIFPPVRLLEFVIGILLAREVRDGTWTKLGLGPALALAAAAYLLAGWVPTNFMWVATTVVPFTLLIGAAARYDLHRPGGLLAHPAMLRLGQWSYAFYLVHPSAITMVLLVTGLRHRTLSVPLALAVTAVIAAVALVGAAALYVVVERPCEKILRPGRSSPAAP